MMATAKSRRRPRRDATKQLVEELTVRCDVCGAVTMDAVHGLVEGVVCDRCPECAEKGLAP